MQRRTSPPKFFNSHPPQGFNFHRSGPRPRRGAALPGPPRVLLPQRGGARGLVRRHVDPLLDPGGADDAGRRVPAGERASLVEAYDALE